MSARSESSAGSPALQTPSREGGPALLCQKCETTEGVAPRHVADGDTRPLCRPCWEALRASAAANIGTLLPAVQGFARRYLVLPGNAEWTAVVLWTAHTYAIDAAHATPYLLVLSPEKRSGKTRTQEVLELLVAQPWRVTGASEAAMFRRIAADRPTLLLDEIDAVFSTYAERTEPLRAILNAGNRPGASVARCAGEGGEEVRDFPVFSAKCLAGIDSGGQLPDTIRDRSIPVRMRRRTSAEPVKRLRWRDAKGEAEPLRQGLAAWGEAASPQLLTADPSIPLELDDRAAEAWEPLLAIADLAGGEWPQRARESAIALSASGESELSLGATLLAAIREAFGESDRITTNDLLICLNTDAELPFGGWLDGHGLDSIRLADLLRPYQIKPRSIRIGDNPNNRGYVRSDFTKAWASWTPQATTARPLEQADVADVADVAAFPRGGGNQ